MSLISSANAVGYWKSASLPFLPDPHDYIDERWDASERACVVSHLQRGQTRQAHLRQQTCRICGGSFGTDDLTDGTWSWPEDLLHYVITHNVKPDHVFVDRVLAQRS
jgi:hypothetical protein